MCVFVDHFIHRPFTQAHIESTHTYTHMCVFVNHFIHRPFTQAHIESTHTYTYVYLRQSLHTPPIYAGIH